MAQVKIYGIGITNEHEQLGFKEDLEMDDASARKLFGCEKEKYRNKLKEELYQQSGIRSITFELKVIYRKDSIEFENIPLFPNSADNITSV